MISSGKMKINKFRFPENFIKSNRIGISIRNLSIKKSTKIERNQGVIKPAIKLAPNIKLNKLTTKGTATDHFVR